MNKLCHFAVGRSQFENVGVIRFVIFKNRCKIVYQGDELGLLKNDCLATKELSKLHQTFDLVNEHYHANLTMEGVVESDLAEEIYRASPGFSQFSFSR